MSRLRTRQVSLTAILSAAYFVLRSVPTFHMIGIGGRFTAADFIPTAIALLAGVWGGTISVIIGTLLAYPITPPIFVGLDFLPAAVNVSVASLIISKRIDFARLFYLLLLVSFLVNPYSLTFGYGPIPYAWLHILAFVILLSPLASRTSVWLKLGGRKQLCAILFLTLVGTMAQHLMGGLLYEFSVGFIGGIAPDIFVGFWKVIFWVYPIERLLIITFSTIIAVAVAKSVHLMNMQLPKSGGSSQQIKVMATSSLRGRYRGVGLNETLNEDI